MFSKISNVDVSKRDMEGYKERRREQLAGREPHSHPPPVTCPLEHGTMQYFSANRQDSPQRCLSFFSYQSAPQPHCLVSALTDRSVTVKLCSDDQNLMWGGLLTNPPTHSKSKCAIKNAHLTSSSRLPNAYASYLRDQEKWYCKRYWISFITYTIQISSGRRQPCCQADWTLGKCETETGLVERHPSGCCLDSHLHTLTDSLSPSPTKCEISSASSVRVKKHDATQKVHCATNNLSTKSGPGINTDVNC